MAITKDKKKELLKQYVEDLKGADSAYVISQNWIPASVSTKVRKEISLADAKINVVRKRIFLRAAEEAGLEKIGLESLHWSTIAIYVKNEDFSPLKVISNQSKLLAKLWDASSFTFLGWWCNKEWKDWAYINELANIPSKEDLISKFLYLLKYPVQSFACVVDQVANKGV